MPRFSDAQLLALLKKSARRLNRTLCLTGTSDEISIDASGCVSPDDQDLEDLVLLQAECLIASREYQSDLAGNGGLLVKDGEQTIDKRNGLLGRGTFFDSKYGPCAELAEQIKLEKLKRFGGGNGCGFDIW